MYKVIAVYGDEHSGRNTGWSFGRQDREGIFFSQGGDISAETWVTREALNEDLSKRTPGRHLCSRTIHLVSLAKGLFID